MYLYLYIIFLSEITEKMTNFISLFLQLTLRKIADATGGRYHVYASNSEVRKLKICIWYIDLAIQSGLSIYLRHVYHVLQRCWLGLVVAVLILIRTTKFHLAFSI